MARPQSMAKQICSQGQMASTAEFVFLEIMKDDDHVMLPFFIFQHSAKKKIYEITRADSIVG